MLPEKNIDVVVKTHDSADIRLGSLPHHDHQSVVHAIYHVCLVDDCRLPSRIGPSSPLPIACGDILVFQVQLCFRIYICSRYGERQIFHVRPALRPCLILQRLIRMIGSILFQYRIFPIVQFRRILMYCGIFVILFTLSVILVFIWQCTPISAFWTTLAGNLPGDHPGRCINVDLFLTIVGSINAATDFALLVLVRSILQFLEFGSG